MQWHRSSYERASLELAYQAHELGLPVTAMARLLIAVAGREAVTDDAARGIELHRSLRLAAHVQSRVGGPRPGHGVRPFMSEFGPTFDQMQPVWTVGAPNAASGLLSLRAGGLPAGGPTVELAGRYQAAVSQVGSGGDWFDAFLVPDGSAALVVGDVAGHSTVAAAAMLQLRALVRTLMTVDGVGSRPVNEVLSQLDAYFVQLGLDLLATVFVGLVRAGDDGAMSLEWCNAGHLPPLLLTADGGTAFLPSADDLLLGCDETVPRTSLRIALPKGSTLLLYSDGLVEDRARALDDGLDRLGAAAQSVAGCGVADFCDGVLAAMVPITTPDDVTLLAVRVPLAAALEQDHCGQQILLS
jgi:Stage II sporulation protein E (SpoIIE)